MDDHQRAMWRRMIERLDAFERNDLDLTKLVQDLRGLFVEANSHDAGVRQGFEILWAELDMLDELRTEPWAPPGSFDAARLRDGVRDLRDYATRVALADSSAEHK